MKKNERRQKARDPMTPLEELRNLAFEYPGELLVNPVLPLLSLENPEAYRLLVDWAKGTLFEKRLKALLRRLPGRVVVAWGVLCVERALPALPAGEARERVEELMDLVGEALDRGPLTDHQAAMLHQRIREIMAWKISDIARLVIEAGICAARELLREQDAGLNRTSKGWYAHEASALCASALDHADLRTYHEERLQQFLILRDVAREHK